VYVDGWFPGFGNRTPLFDTDEPSNAQGWSRAPHVGSEGKATAGVSTSSLSSPPASESGSIGAYGPPGPWLSFRQAFGSLVGTNVAVCGVSVPSQAACTTSPWCTVSWGPGNMCRKAQGSPTGGCASSCSRYVAWAAA